MKKIVVIFLIVIFMVLLLPLAVVHLIGSDMSSVEQTEKQKSEQKEEGKKVSVFFADDGHLEDVPISNYLKCVVSAEMPADFEEEALKAQAVAARTYLYAHIEQAEKGNVAESHNGAPICTDSTHCQAYINKEKRCKSWGQNADAYWDKISRAVDETAGQIMTYKGEIISAVFHSTSSGTTESAVDVWGSDIPYLKSVASAGDTESPKYQSDLTVSTEKYKRMIDKEIEGTDWEKALFSNINRSDAGGIVTLDVGGITIKGTEFRSIFSLRSTNVELVEANGNVTMRVKGFGHGVGMSQYGADYMASQGSNYEDILKTYYTGIKIEQR